MIPRSWLIQPPLDADALEHEHTTTDERSRFVNVPFGALNKSWLALKAQIRPGDQLLKFSNGPAEFRRMAGRAGVALVREGVVIAEILTRFN
jgi:hypothetical protein